jgi:putative copper resistance protein D
VWTTVERVSAATAAALFAAGCAIDWRTDMWFQPAKGPEAEPRPEPERSVALGAGGPRYEEHDDTEELVDPVAADRASLERGRGLFQERCVPCHGKDGHGNGPVSRFFPPAPDLAYPTVVKRSDGYIFGTIRFGGRAMPALGDGLTDAELWDLVNLVRAIQRGTP